jgi:hypothetical protein
MQSYGFSPTIDKPTRDYKDPATLIGNILSMKQIRQYTMWMIQEHGNQYV